MHKIAVIIPCYNEEKRLDFLNVNQLISCTYLHVFFANDGSSDDTKILIEQYIEAQPSNNVTLINFEENSGKANTIYKSINLLIENESITHFGYLDADFSTSSEEFIRLSKFLKNDSKFDFVIASRVQLLNSHINRKLYRHIIGRIIVTIINFKFHLGVYDTQCGAKILSREIAKIGFSKPFNTSWLFDAEMFIRLKSQNLLQYGQEIPIKNWVDVAGSKLKPKHAFMIFKEMISLFKIY